MITVTVEPFFELKEIIGKPRLEMEVAEGTTVREFLMGLVERYGQRLRSALFNPESGEIYGYYVIFINEKQSSLLPEGLQTRLNDGDVITILVPVRGGL